MEKSGPPPYEIVRLRRPQTPPNWPILYPFPLPCGIQVVLPTTFTELISGFLGERYLSFSIKL